MNPVERKLSGILHERYHEIWSEEMTRMENEVMDRRSEAEALLKDSISTRKALAEVKERHSRRTYAREIMHRARRRWHIMLWSLGARTALEQWDPPPPVPGEVIVPDPSGFELDLPNGFVVLPAELATKILVLGGLP